MLYLIVIILATALSAAINILLSSMTAENIYYISLSSLIATISVILIDGLGALIIRRLFPKSLFAPHRKIFAVSKNEYQFYRKLKIKRWKDKIPELGGFTSFHKDKLASTSSPSYLERFLLESNYGVIIHIQNAIFGFLILFIPFCHSPSIWVPVFIVNFILSLLPVAVLRYNSYTLLRLYNRALKKQEEKN